MSKFKVGDTVRIKDDASRFGWLRPGEMGVITGFDHEVVLFADPAGVSNQSRYWQHEIVEPAQPKKVTAKEIRSLLREARRALAVMDDPDATYEEYARAQDKFAKAVEGVVNK